MPMPASAFLVTAAVLLLLRSPAAYSKTCPACGNAAVPYPLSTDAGCGDPLYKIRCSGSPPSLFFDALNGSSYPITSISPSAQLLVIRPAPFSSPSSCTTADLRYMGIQLDPSLPFNVTSSNTILLLNCTSRLLLSPLNCTSSSPCHAYADATPAAAACRSSPICCTFVAGGSSTSHSIKASAAGCSAYRSFVNLSPGTVPVSLWGKREGLELQWISPPEPVCSSQSDCDFNATCSTDPTAAVRVRRCFCNSGLRWDPISGSCAEMLADCSSDCGSNHAPLIAGLVAGLTAALAAALAAWILYRRQRRLRLEKERLLREREEILNANNTSGRSAKNFTGKEIKQATRSFAKENLLGSGGFGEVFKGTLADGSVVAVKCAMLGNTKSVDQVLNEVRILSQVNHRSMVRLLGCCVELQQPIMVYEFIPNGTLFEHLHGLRPTESAAGQLGWRRRLVIAHQTAEGLAYLHSSAVPPIYHRDVKSSNILLDEKMNAKVSDFGLSRLAEPGISHISTCAQGTLGYLDPEYYRNYQLTDKSDVYSFGVVLLELLTSQKAIDFRRETDDVNLAMYVQQRADEERLMDVVDEVLKKGATQVELDTMKAIGLLAMSCIEQHRQNRPSMKEVAEEIQYIMNIEAGGAQQLPSL